MQLMTPRERAIAAFQGKKLPKIKTDRTLARKKFDEVKFALNGFLTVLNEYEDYKTKYYALSTQYDTSQMLLSELKKKNQNLKALIKELTEKLKNKE